MPRGRRCTARARPLSPPLLAAAGAFAGIGFTVSLLISSLAFSGQRLEEAKLGALGSVVLAPLLAWTVLQVVRRLPASVRARQIAGTAEDILDLSREVDPERDHIRGAEDAPVTLVEYGDFECPYCGQAEQVIRELLASSGDDVRYVWRHLPLNDVHPNAQIAAEASEAAAAQGRFWEMHDTLLGHQGDLRPTHLADYATEIGIDADRMIDGAAPPRVRGAGQRRRRQRRRERRLRHAHVLHQRTPPLRRLRHRHAERRGDSGARTRAPDRQDGGPGSGMSACQAAHPLRWLAERDRDLAALRRAGRTAIVMPAMFAIGEEVIGNPVLATFAAFGSFAMLLLVDFGGPLRVAAGPPGAARDRRMRVRLHRHAGLPERVAGGRGDGARRLRGDLRRRRQLGARRRDDLAAARVHPAGDDRRARVSRYPIAWRAGAWPRAPR